MQTSDAATKYYSESIYKELLKHEMAVSDLASEQLREFVKFPIDKANGITMLCIVTEDKVATDGRRRRAGFCEVSCAPGSPFHNKKTAAKCDGLISYGGVNRTRICDLLDVNEAL